ncbi:MAG: transposase [Bradyrhizobium sp.]|nr:transposase [Bradyrhizobium sp.]
MKSNDGFVQAYNARSLSKQIIGAQDVTQNPTDSGQLVPMIDATKVNLGRYPAQASADNGYCSEANLEALEARNIDGYVATGRARDAVSGKAKDGDDDPPAPPDAGPRRRKRSRHRRRRTQSRQQCLRLQPVIRLGQRSRMPSQRLAMWR